MAHAIKTIDELNMKQEEEEGCVVRLRGLPWSTTKEDIVQFFSDCHVADGINGVHLTSTKEGRPTGEGYLELETVEDVEQALKKHNEHMGTRYVEVFRSKRSEMEWVVKRSGVSESSPEEGCVRLRGLPFGCSKEEIAMFFSGLEIVPNGITLTTDFQGRSSGEAYVQFISKEVAEKALAKHKEKIGHRYIEIFRSSLSEVRAAAGVRGGQRGGTAPGPFGGNNRPSPYDRGDRFGGMNRYGTSRGRVKEEEWGGRPDYARAAPVRGRFEGGPGHRIHMRGLPFRASEDDIAEFFRPFRPVSIRLVYDNTGRPSGEADVEFDNHDEALKAMAKDKQTMQHRYIELFLNSTPGTATSNFGAGYAGGYNTPGYAPRAGW